TDDHGYGDLSCMGSTDVMTPNLDRLADDGVRFTDFYSNSPVCSPSRASLLTGRYPARAGVRSILAGHRTASGLRSDVTSMVQGLKNEGYNTYMSGKWHLGLADESRPSAQGFDHWYGFLAGCIDYYSHIFYWGINRGGPGQNPIHDLWEDDKEIWDNGKYMTQAITDKAIDYVRDATKNEEPFVLYVAYNAPHYPMHAPQKFMDRFAHLPWDKQVLAAMISAVDDGVGDIVDELERQGVRENTCIFFMGDNGPSRESRNWLDGTLDPYYGSSAGKLKGHKFSLYDGGIRVPGLLNWPAKIPAKQVLDQPVAAMDIMPTMLKAAGGDPSQYGVDGINILPYVCKGEDLPQRDLYWEMNDQTAIRRGQHKLVLKGQLVEGAPAEDQVHLSDLSQDMGEKNNLAKDMTELADALQKAALHWRDGIEKNWQVMQQTPTAPVTYTADTN
ncbi:MAG TPA: sulfatase, partial [Phycisphaerales bacterium]|nr:sulfatase [Phycisphaerales bacterium]